MALFSRARVAAETVDISLSCADIEGININVVLYDARRRRRVPVFLAGQPPARYGAASAARRPTPCDTICSLAVSWPSR